MMTNWNDATTRRDEDSLRDYRRYALAAAAIALGAYLLTIARDLTWANASFDGVELITASATLGIAHPPGYPTYVLLGKLFSLLPIGTVAFRYNFFSAVATAAAAGLLVLAIGGLQRRARPAAALAAALLFAFAPLVWSQATVAEIYALNALMVAAFLVVVSKRGASTWSGLLLGLAITTHLTSLFLLPLLFVRPGRPVRPALAGVAYGLSPLLALPLLARGDSPVLWGRPLDVAGWWWLVSGRLYGANLRPALDLGHLNTVLHALILGPAALVAANKARQPAVAAWMLDRLQERRVPLLLTLSATLYIAFALLYQTPDAAVLLIPALLLAAILVAPALDRLGPAALLLPLALAVLTYPARDVGPRNGGPMEVGQGVDVRGRAMTVLSAAPPDALLLSPGDRSYFTMHYFQSIEGQRADLRVIDANLFAFDWYRDRLRERYPELVVPLGDDLGALVSENARPICFSSLLGEPEIRFDRALLREASPTDSPYLICN